MTSRILPVNEWPKLLGTELHRYDVLDPNHTVVYVVEQGDQIIGCWAFMHVVHLEGLWIDPNYRKQGSVFRRLLYGMRDTVTGFFRAHAAITTAVSEDVARIVSKYGGVKLPGEHYAVPVRSL